MATTNAELHAPHWHGNVVVAQHMRTDVLTLLTMGMQVADMVPDNEGIWLFHCRVEPHLAAGMQMRFQVTDAATYDVDPSMRSTALQHHTPIHRPD